MNYYEKHLGDYARDTGHLSMAEHGAYNLLLDRYYATEQGIPAQIVYAVARATKAPERATVDRILAQFFRLKDGRWVHGRVEEEIAKVHAKSQKARDAAAKRWHSDGNANASPEHGDRICETHPLQSPVTSHQEKESTAAAPPRPEFSENFETAWAEYPKRNGDNPKRAAAKAWSARITAGRTPAEMIDGVRRYAAWCRDTGKAGTETVMQAKRFFGPDEPFKNAWSAAPEKVRVVIPDCNVPGCKREGLPGLGGKCEIHYNQSRPLTPAQIAAGIA